MVYVLAFMLLVFIILGSRILGLIYYGTGFYF